MMKKISKGNEANDSVRANDNRQYFTEIACHFWQECLEGKRTNLDARRYMENIAKMFKYTEICTTL